MTLESNNGSVIRNDKSKARQVINEEIEYETHNDADELFRALVLGLDDEDVTYHDTDDNEDEEYERYIEGGI